MFFDLFFASYPLTQNKFVFAQKGISLDIKPPQWAKAV